MMWAMTGHQSQLQARIDEEEERLEQDCRSRGLPFLSLYLSPLCIDTPILQQNSQNQAVPSLRMCSQRKVYGIRAVPDKGYIFFLEILIEQCSAHVMTCLGRAGEESISISFGLVDAQQSFGPESTLQRKMYSQDSFDHRNAITDLSHGDVKDIFAQIRSLLKGQILAPTLDPRYGISVIEFDEILFAVMLGTDIGFWDGRKPPSLFQIFTKSMKGKHIA